MTEQQFTDEELGTLDYVLWCYATLRPEVTHYPDLHEKIKQMRLER